MDTCDDMYDAVTVSHKVKLDFYLRIWIVANVAEHLRRAKSYTFPRKAAFCRLIDHSTYCNLRYLDSEPAHAPCIIANRMEFEKR